MAMFGVVHFAVYLLLLSSQSSLSDAEEPSDHSNCTTEELKLIRAQRENRKFILNFISPVLFLDTNLTDVHDQDIPLFTFYEKFTKKENLKLTEKGFSNFVEAVDEMTAAYTESLVLESSRSLLKKILPMAQRFNRLSVYKQENMVEVRSIYGKMVYLDDEIRKINERRNKRQTGLEFDLECNIERSKCKCPEGGMDNVKCTCQFFDCIDRDDQLGPIFGFNYSNHNCLAFVMDTTGSMIDEINYTVQILRNFIGSEEELGCFMFVPFNDRNSNPDESVGNVTVALDNLVLDLIDFISTIENAFEPHSGGDCPEYSYHGIMKALDSLRDNKYIQEFGSQIIVLTDAAPKGDITADQIISSANQTEVCIHFFLSETNTFDCVEDYSNTLMEYQHIANETGGILVKKNSFSNFVMEYKNKPCRFPLNFNDEIIKPSLSGVQKRTVNVNRTDCRQFTVSKLSNKLKLNIQNVSRTVIIHKPDDSVVNITGTYFLEKKPLAGVWTVCAMESFPEISHRIEISMDVTPFYFAQENNQNVLKCTAPPGCTKVKIAMYSSRSELISSSWVQLLSKTGENIAEATLSKCNSSWTGEVLTPAVGNYTYQMKGQDTSNNPFTYFTKRRVSFKSGEEYFKFFSSNDNVTADIYEPVRLSFILENSNPFGSSTFQFVVEDLYGFITTVTPHQAVIESGGSVEVRVTLRVGRSSIRPGSYDAIASASNGCMTLSIVKKFQLIIRPRTGPLCNLSCENDGTCVLIRRRYGEFTRCLCPTNFIGRRCETRRIN